MPRARQKALFELGGQWIAREVGKPGFYRYWHDAGTGHSRRASLGTSDPEEAKTRLAEIVVRGAVKTTVTPLSIVLEEYFLNKTDHLVSKGTARNAGRLLLECWGDLVQTGDLTEANQKKFVKWSLTKRHAISTVARNLGVLAAALEHSKLSVDVIYNEGAILAKWPEIKPKPARKIYEPTDEELARLLRAPIPEDLRRWVLNAMATGGRPEAVLGICPDQRHRNFGLIDLNPEGRRQNKKYRATVRELKAQSRWLNQWEKEAAALAKKGQNRAAAYCGYANVDSVDTALRRWRIKPIVNIPKLSVYSFRHRVASVLRASKAPRVPEEQVNYQLGHRRPGNRTSRGYGQYGPEYLDEAATVLEAWVAKVLRLAKQDPAVKKERSAA
jgi:integrase